MSIDYKFTLESFFRTTESFEDPKITAQFIAVSLEMAAQIKMSENHYSESVCEKSLRQLARQTRLSISTVQREIRKILTMGIFERIGYSETGKPIFEPGHQWFSEQKCIIERKRQIARCGTRADSMKVEQPVENPVTPGPRDQGGVVPETRGGSPRDQHITNAFTGSITKKLFEQQPDLKITNREKKPMQDIEPLHDPEIAMQNDDIQTYEQKKEVIQMENRNLYKNMRAEYINSRQSTKIDSLKAMKELAKRLGKENELKHNMHGIN